MIWLLIREYLAGPMLYYSWLLKVLYLATPEGIMWGLFLLFTLIVALVSLQIRRTFTPREVSFPPQYAERRVFQLANWVRHGQRPFYRTRLNYTLTKLFVGTLALKRRDNESEVREIIRSGELDLPGDLQAYLQAGLKRWPAETAGRKLTPLLYPRRSSASQDRDLLERMILYLEEELEIRDDHWRS